MLSHFKAFWNYLRAYLAFIKDVKGDNIKNNNTQHDCFIENIYIGDIFFVKVI